MAAVLGPLDRLVEWTLAAILAALVGIGGLQIITRFVLAASLAWAAEASILLLVWATMLSGYVGVRRDLHLSADFVGLSLGSRAHWWVQLSSLLLCLVFVVVYGGSSSVVIDAMDGIPFAALPFTQPVIYWSLPVSAALMAVALLDRIGRHLRGPTQPPSPS